MLIHIRGVRQALSLSQSLDFENRRREPYVRNQNQAGSIPAPIPSSKVTACSQVLDSRPLASGKYVRGIQAMWNAADIGPSWLDLRALSSLQSLSVSGILSFWLPTSLKSLTFLALE